MKVTAADAARPARQGVVAVDSGGGSGDGAGDAGGRRFAPAPEVNAERGGGQAGPLRRA